jgi:hypothetical protein
MARPAADLTVAELTRILNVRRDTLRALNKRRSKLQTELRKVEAEIRAVTGTAGPGRRGRKSANSLSLRETVLQLLQKTKKGYSLSDLSQTILESGYETSSTNFRNVLYQCLYNMAGVYHDEKTGTYKYKEPPAKPKPASSAEK